MNEDRALSGQDIIKAFNGRINLLTYDDLQKYDNIDEMLKPYGKAVLLYFWSKNQNGVFGHWISIRKSTKKYNTIEVFNSFGDWIDSNLDKIPIEFRQKNNEDYKQLSYLLYKSPYKIDYNEFQFQDNKSQTCGRWSIYFLRRDDLTLEQFQKLWNKKNFKLNDNNIIKLTNDI